jgi:hypothetical protein
MILTRSPRASLTLGPMGRTFPPRMTPLTKSRLAEFEQCEKRFWLAVHKPELAALRDANVFATDVTPVSHPAITRVLG